MPTTPVFWVEMGGGPEISKLVCNSELKMAVSNYWNTRTHLSHNTKLVFGFQSKTDVVRI